MNLERTKRQLTRHEGLRLAVYDDATGKPLEQGDTIVGHPTVGVGRLLTDARGISTIEAEMFLDNDIDIVVDELNKNIPWWNNLNDARKATFINLCFNLGWPRLSGFKKMLRAAQAGAWDKAADELMDSLWYQQVGLRGPELVEQLKTGVFQEE